MKKWGKFTRYLPDEIVEEILARLPVKCLIKCRCVCLVWRDLIRSQYFIDFHLSHPSRKKNTDDYMVVNDTRRNLSFYSRDEDGGFLRVAGPRNFPDQFSVRHVCRPCNGIICLVGNHGDDEEEVIYLWNHATGEYRRLPNRTLLDPPFEEAYSFGIYTCGLGFDPCTNEYKVVSVLFYADWELEDFGDAITPGCYQTAIYDLSSNLWKEVELDLPDTMRIVSKSGSEYYKDSWLGSGLLMNGRLHWVLDDMKSETIVYFDVSNEVMEEIPFPPNDSLENEYACGYIDLLEDSLALVLVSKPDICSGSSCSVFLWTMMDYGTSESWWMKRFSISLSFPPYGAFSLSPLVLRWGNNDMILRKYTGELVSINLAGDGCQMKTQKLDDHVYTATVVRSESLVPLR